MVHPKTETTCQVVWVGTYQTVDQEKSTAAMEGFMPVLQAAFEGMATKLNASA